MKLIFKVNENGVKSIDNISIFKNIDVAYINTAEKDLFFNFKDSQIKVGDVLITFNDKVVYNNVYNEILKSI
jgi:hypothetical protein